MGSPAPPSKWAALRVFTSELAQLRRAYAHQAAGHHGAFIKISDHDPCLCKHTTSNEQRALELLQRDALQLFVPRVLGVLVYNDAFYVQMEDLLWTFQKPRVIDIKLGTRTFLENEVEQAQLRADLLLKMSEIDPRAPTELERQLGGITKLRYMQFRESTSTSALLGFRIDGIRADCSEFTENIKRVDSEQLVTECLQKFFASAEHILQKTIMQKLYKLQQLIQTSEFVKTHEIIGSSILVAYDKLQAGVWLIDFAKCVAAPIEINHRDPWQPGNHEDGFLYGVDNLLRILKSVVHSECASVT